MLELVLLRHPETQWNKDKLLQGQSDIPALDTIVPDDLVQAILEMGFVAAVYTSDLQRCRLPAYDLYRKLVGKTKAPVLYCETQLLRERCFGELEGRSYEALRCDSFAQVGKYLYDIPDIPGGETSDAVLTRAKKVLTHFVRYQDTVTRTVIPVITHGCFMNYLLSALEWNDHEDGLLPYRSSGNLSGFRVSITKLGVQELFPFPSHSSAHGQ